MKVLVTGCNGQVGHCLIQQLEGKAEFLAVDRDQLDITDQISVYAFVSKFAPDFVINAAAHTAVDKAEEEVDLSFAVNRDGPKYLAEAAEMCGAVMLHISTDYVFDGKGSLPYKENASVAPQGVYGQSKLAGEQAVAKSCRRHLILRTAWVFGEHGNNFVKTMLRLAAERKTLNIVCDQIGGPTYAGDIAKALIKIMEQIEQSKETKWGVYHFSGMPHVSWYKFADAIFDQAEEMKVIAHKPILKPIATSEFPTPAKRPENSRLDCSKIALDFGIAPSDWQKALSSIQRYK